MFHIRYTTYRRLTRIALKYWSNFLKEFSGDSQIRTVGMARLIKLGNAADNHHAVSAAVESLQAGHVIAVPTDTIYGVAALAQSTASVKQLYNIKGRNGNNPIAICVGDIEDLQKWSEVPVSTSLLSDLLPGPVTLVFKRRPELNPELNPFTSLVGIRIPDYPFIREVARAVGSPLALTSANISATRSTLAVQEFEELWPKLDLILDGGQLGDTVEARLGSTVVNLSIPGQFTIIRPGSAHSKTVDILSKKHGLLETR
ncbi:yrdC domain-containing protein, mitochondrial-like isoform X2 [Acanthaster planci]|uniref:Threonylcarbamoyl-AMP synthase n=1 Tax=Acanthaster planci TaxID=133434 RepID=A0A8B7XMN0_ACAPL|nr:yrdC domain-containing protein, mitochondrial-like isoform X2 [Acanthaster planci]